MKNNQIDNNQRPEDKTETSTQSQPKKSKIGIIIGLIVFLLVILLGLGAYYLYIYVPQATRDLESKNSVSQNDKQNNPESKLQMANWKTTASNSSDMVLIDNRAYIYENNTVKPLTPKDYKVIYQHYATPFLLLQKQSQLFVYDIPNRKIKDLGLTLNNTNDNEQKIIVELTNTDSDKIIFDLNTYNKNTEKEEKYNQDDMSITPPVTSSQEYSYTFSTGKLSKTNIYNTAVSLINKYDDNTYQNTNMPTTKFWDSKENIVYIGGMRGKAVMEETNLYKVNLNNNTVQKGKNESILLSPSLDKFVTISKEGNQSAIKEYLSDDFQNLSKPIGEYSTSSENNIMGWTQDENKLLLSHEDYSKFEVYSLDFKTKQIKTLFQKDRTNYDIKSPINISPDGNSITYLWWSVADNSDQHSKLMKIDLNNGSETTLYNFDAFVYTGPLTVITKQ